MQMAGMNFQTRSSAPARQKLNFCPAVPGLL
ncbi:DUF6783 domain-containing protein [Robinsoniella peoriensis]